MASPTTSSASGPAISAASHSSSSTPSSSGSCFMCFWNRRSSGTTSMRSGAIAPANGIRVARMDIALYAISGGVAALAGILGAARLSTASPAAGGASLTFQVITAAILGGTSLFGGIGTIAGSALGAILFAEISNGLQVRNVNALYQNIFIGVILVAAVAIDQYRRRRRYRAGS